MHLSLMSVGKYRKTPRIYLLTLNGCNSKNSKRMTTPLSKMVALLISSPLTPRRGLGSAGSLSEVKKGVAWSWHGRVAQICAEGNMGKNSVGANLRRRKVIIRNWKVKSISYDSGFTWACLFLCTSCQTSVSGSWEVISLENDNSTFVVLLSKRSKVGVAMFIWRLRVFSTWDYPF